MGISHRLNRTELSPSMGDPLAGCVSVLEQLLENRGAAVDLTVVRRAVRDAQTAWPGLAEERWWKWLTEAGRSLGLELRVVDAHPGEIAQVVRDQDCIAGFLTRNDQPWLVVRPTRRRAELLRFGQPAGSAEPEVISYGQLAHLLAGPEPQYPVRCVVLEPSMPVDMPAGHAGSPFERLIGLMRPEWNDIWIVLVFAVFVGLLVLATPVAVEALVNTVAFGRFLQPVVVLAIMLFAFLAFAGAMRALQTFVVEIIQRRLFVRIAGDLARRLPRVRAEALDGHYGPELVNRFFDVVTVQKVVASLLLDAVTIVLGTVIGMAVLAFYHPWLLGFDIVLLTMIALVIFGLGRGAVDSSVKESKRKYRMADWLEELTRCPTAFRYGGGAQAAAERADLLAAEYLQDRRKHFRVLFRQIMFAVALEVLATTVLLGLGGWLVIQGQLTLGQLVAAELIVVIIVGSFAKLGKHLENFYDLLAAVDKIGVLTDLPLERSDGLLAVPCEGPAAVRASEVNYQHRRTKRGLSPFSCDVQPGESVAVLGPAGAGKSTLADLLFGLREPSGGQLEIAGFSPRDLRPDILRQHVALVRSVEVFGGTIAQNVHLERPQVTTTNVREALDRVGLLEDVLALPHSMDTVLTSGGDLLSEGQARRLTIARAMAGQPRLLIIDGTLDALPEEDAEQTLWSLTAPDAPWTLLVLTGRRDIASRCQRTLTLNAPASRSQRQPQGGQ